MQISKPSVHNVKASFILTSRGFPSTRISSWCHPLAFSTTHSQIPRFPWPWCFQGERCLRITFLTRQSFQPYRKHKTQVKTRTRVSVSVTVWQNSIVSCIPFHAARYRQQSEDWLTHSARTHRGPWLTHRNARRAQPTERVARARKCVSPYSWGIAK